MCEKEKTKRAMVRLDRAVREQLEANARKGRRSLSAEIAHRIDQTLERVLDSADAKSAT